MLWLSFFPKLIAGPIERYDRFVANFEREDYLRFDQDNVKRGLLIAAWGYFQKIMIADRIGLLVDTVYADLEAYQGVTLVLVMLLYSVQIYTDFAGYSYIALGLSRVLGITLTKNFNHPYFADSFTDFWSRWHISLSTWLRDYIYIPLGGSRVSEGRIFLNLLVVWLITGFWHGVTLNFILWGLIIFVIIAFERFVIPGKIPVALGKIIGRVNVLILIPLTWVIFAISDFRGLLDYFKRLFPFFGKGIAVNSSDYIKNLGIYGGFLAVALILLLPGLYRFFERNRKHPVFTVLLFILFWICVYSLSNAAGNPFMYFRF